MEKIGALWLRKDKNGKLYMSGKIREEKIYVFRNKFKKEDKHPDYIVNAADDEKGEDYGKLP